MGEKVESRRPARADTDHGDRSHRRQYGIDRRECLRLVGAAGVAATGAVAATNTAGASSHYTTYTVDSGETFRRDIDSDETFENALIDATAEDTDVRIDASGSNWTIRNVGIKGQLSEADRPALRLQVSGGSTGTVENVYLGDGAVEGGHGGMFVPTDHEGTLQIRGLNVQYWPDNGEYGSAPGRSERGGRGGLIEIERSYARNNNVAGFRLGTDRSVVRDSVVHVDGGVPANAAGQVNARGIWVKEGGSISIESCDVLLEDADGSYCVWEGDDNSVSLARVIDSEIAARDGAEGRYRGNVETQNVGDDPNVSRSPDVPASAKEAAVGRNFRSAVRFAGGSDGDRLEYVLETTGEIAGTRSTESGDNVSGGRVVGATGGDDDIVRYDGEITTLDASLPAGGDIASVTIDRSAGEIDFDCGPRNDDRLDYYLRVTGSIEPTGNINGHDTYTESEAKGHTGNSGRDTYTYTDDVSELRARLADGTLLEVEIDAA